MFCELSKNCQHFYDFFFHRIVELECAIFTETLNLVTRVELLQFCNAKILVSILDTETSSKMASTLNKD